MLLLLLLLLRNYIMFSFSNACPRSSQLQLYTLALVYPLVKVDQAYNHGESNQS